MNQYKIVLDQWVEGLDDEARSLAERFGRRIGHLRVACGLSKTEFGQALGVRRQMVDRYENGIDLPRLNVVLRICVVLGLDPTQLLAGLMDLAVPVASPRLPVADRRPPDVSPQADLG